MICLFGGQGSRQPEDDETLLLLLVVESLNCPVKSGFIVLLSDSQ